MNKLSIPFLEGRHERFLQSHVYEGSEPGTLTSLLPQIFRDVKNEEAYFRVPGESAAASAGALLIARWEDVSVSLDPPPGQAVSNSMIEVPSKASVGVWSSGSTGVPKLHWQEVALLQSHLVQNRDASLRGSSWGFLYDPRRLAGLSVIATSLATESRFTWSSPSFPLEARLRHFIEQRVDRIALTPSQSRFLLGSRSFAELALKSITLGGEHASQNLLDALRARHPDAKIIHVYAASEIGTITSASDGKEGYPAHKFEPRASGRFAFIRNDELVMQLEDGDQLPTGDLFNLVSGRYVFRGRKNRSFSVGGNLVFPEQIESKILDTLPWAREVRVTPLPNRILGNVVACEIVPDSGLGIEVIPENVSSLLRSRLARHETPVEITLRRDSMLGITGKLES